MSKTSLLLILFVSAFLINCNTKNTNKAKEADSMSPSITHIENGDFSETSSEKNTSNYSFISDISFYNELLSVLNKKKDTAFIMPRYSLERINSTFISDSLFKTEYTSSSNTIYAINIKTRPFNPSNHIFKVDTSRQDDGTFYVFSNDTIDGKRIYGVDRTIPTKQIDIFEIAINGRVISIPAECFNDLYQLNLSYTEAYESKDGKYLFLYLKGSDGAASYTTKLIFSTNGYITRILTPLCGYDFIDGVKYDCV